MTVYQVMNLSFVDDHTVILIRDEAFNLLGGFVRIHRLSYSHALFVYSPQMIRWWPFDVKSFSWDDDNDLYIMLKGMG